MYTQHYGANPQFYYHNQSLPLECGETLTNPKIAYHTYGKLSPEKDNVIWVCHALTANSDVADWWPGTVIEGGLLDPTKYFVVCANKLGSCYGSSSPMDYAPNYLSFPNITIRDVVEGHKLLAKHLGINKIKLLVGGSTGGAQAMEWAIMEPDRVENLSVTVSLPKCTPWIVADNEAQRMAIRADKSFYSDEPGGGGDGLAAARAVSMLIYRSPEAFNMTQRDDQEKLSDFRAASYQRYQGEKLRKRFDARCYYTLLNALDSHDVGRGRGGVQAALSKITARTSVIAIDSDLLFPACDIERFTAAIPGAKYHVISSPFGHDGFLIETAKITEILKEDMGI